MTRDELLAPVIADLARGESAMATAVDIALRLAYELGHKEALVDSCPVFKNLTDAQLKELADDLRDIYHRHDEDRWSVCAEHAAEYVLDHAEIDVEEVTERPE